MQDEPVSEINIDDFAKSAAAAAVSDDKLTRVSTLLAKDRDTAYAPTSVTVPGESPAVSPFYYVIFAALCFSKALNQF